MVRLDQATFKRLVWLHIVSGVACVVAVLPQYLVGRWYEFSLAFDVLVDQRFGPDDTSVPVAIGLGVAGFAGVAWMVASLVGLLRLRQWGRSGLIGSTGLLFAVYLAAFGFRPVVVSPLDDVLAFIDSALFGGIVLLAYAKDHGAIWFAQNAAD